MVHLIHIFTWAHVHVCGSQRLVLVFLYFIFKTDLSLSLEITNCLDWWDSKPPQSSCSPLAQNCGHHHTPSCLFSCGWHGSKLRSSHLYSRYLALSCLSSFSVVLIWSAFVHLTPGNIWALSFHCLISTTISYLWRTGIHLNLISWMALQE